MKTPSKENVTTKKKKEVKSTVILLVRHMLEIFLFYFPFSLFIIYIKLDFVYMYIV